MSLTGSFFLTLVIVVTVAAFVALVVLWPALSGRTPGKIAGRVGMLLLVNFLVLLTAATQLNAQYLFFADWTDLTGAFTNRTTQTTLNRGTSAAVAARTKVRDAPAAAARVGKLQPLPATAFDAAGVGSFTVKGPVSGVTGTVMVQVPPGYLAPANGTKRYPVIETFSGYPGLVNQWIGPMNLGAVMNQEVSLHHLRPALIVSPQVEFPPGTDTECVNGTPPYPQVETWLTQDVPTWVAQHFRVAPSRLSWATIGLSAGGWCAAMATLLHPNQYGAALVLGGYFHPDLSPFYEPYPLHGALAERYNLVRLARTAAPPVAIWLETSHTDPVSYHSSAEFLRATRTPTSVHAVVLQHGGHRISLWQALLPDTMRWLGSAMPGFR